MSKSKELTSENIREHFLNFVGIGNQVQISVITGQTISGRLETVAIDHVKILTSEENLSFLNSDYVEILVNRKTVAVLYNAILTVN
ncbi:hypothetical protein [Priestia megaterium]|uniref:hypothetical protein n=1 Tax=Priestia megaterium TaxID=1404 RepID=UPI00203BE084|nr:hypothetical protein [Priestia megaterium]MCM3197189.1 hypothetical protein [Priestia megaterium]